MKILLAGDPMAFDPETDLWSGGAPVARTMLNGDFADNAFPAGADPDREGSALERAKRLFSDGIQLVERGPVPRRPGAGAVE